ncbi:deoxyribose-phosphate aldolase [Amylolactobacillus amylotrophicus DSM 20534]|uniref:Deoxyribose-phosphate aldolase n=3 Tax=Amylolactobacillus TaxID=2767876 RepID=A0A1L6XCJ0_9LACO|nr:MULTISPECIES: deoxyribose-phosphate aldolase [Amylolactobacillus]APT18684.1 deoxyribose-phosphate aldolase [Amylolactobacillus amylophilus DSM 20533 = JCM 1125]KRK37752.1 deoxyribose-phosphate aldolase [Amylolactobacillus amylotrophicus DSM 20534]KRM41540.1 deoxyribose-phosphate aldolase [Amylolactobacillus amylophilus DSM 20533 = JCM 1125]GED80769.1 deoxyribose-phosphate aldolase [Amylolactobacillus amylophilus]
MDKPLAKYIDHTILKPEATKDEVMQVINEAKQYGFASVCVNPYWVELAATELKETDVNVCTVVGFPLGATSTFAKVSETSEALKDGAVEIDMVQNIGTLLSGDEQTVREDIKAVALATHAGNAILKVILENAFLTDEQIKRACELAVEAGADFVKTSTGFAKSGAKAADVRLMRETVGDKLGVKAAGGIHTKAEALAMIEAGASRIGASASIAIVTE